MNKTDDDGNTPLMWACLITNHDNIELIQLLINAGTNVNAKCDTGETALMFAAAFTTKPAVIKALIAAGADINARDREGKRPIDSLESRFDRAEFSKTDAYWEIRQMLH